MIHLKSKITQWYRAVTGIQGQTCPLYSAFHLFHLVQFSTHSRPTLCNPVDCSTPGLPSITNSWNLLKLMSIESMMLTNHLILIIPFSSCLQSFPASGFFPMSRFFPSGGQSIGASASASVLSMNIRDWFPLGLTGLILLSESSPKLQFKSNMYLDVFKCPRSGSVADGKGLDHLQFRTIGIFSDISWLLII